MTTVTRQVHFTTKARRKIAVPGRAPGLEPQRTAGRIPRVAKLMALAIRFDQLIRVGNVADQSKLAHLVHVTQPRITQIMNLLHLAPDIQEQLLYLRLVEAGDDSITERDLRAITRVRDWAEQRATWQRLTSGVAASIH